jgi:ornithine cyclodeaminase
LWDAETGRVVALVEAFALGQLRTAAVSAVATGALARTDAATLAMIGTGKQALAQIAAVQSQRPLRRVHVYSPTPEHREQFAERVVAALPDVEVRVAATAAEAVQAADIVVTATRATRPVLEPGMLPAGVHVNALGAITPERCELSAQVAAGAQLVVSDSPAAARTLSAELVEAHDVRALADIVVDGWERRGDAPTVFKAMGLGLADVAIGAQIVSVVAARGGGRPIPAPTRAAPRLFPDVNPQGR